MTYLASTLVSRAWNLSGIVAAELETVSGSESTTGLFLLNELLEMKSSDLRLIPYFTRSTLTLVQGQESYFIPNLCGIETITFNLGDVRYPMSIANRNNYFGTGRVNNIQSLPFEWHLERELGGSRLYVYYLPMEGYVAQYSGKFALTDVTLNTNLSTVYDGFYLAYLRRALARFMCQEYDVEYGQDKERLLKTIEKKLMDVSPPDLTLKKTQFIKNRTSLNWGIVNISQGWVPG